MPEEGMENAAGVDWLLLLLPDQNIQAASEHPQHMEASYCCDMYSLH